LIEQQIIKYQTLHEWFQSPLGLFLAEEFLRELEPAKKYLRGDILLQLNSCGDNLWLDNLNYIHKWIASPFMLKQNVNLEFSLNQIPLARNSVDCVLAPLTLEPFGTNMGLIDEIDRVLKSMGFVVLLCINPWSLWGAAMKLGLLHCYDSRKIKMLSPFNLNRLFIQRGYRQCSLSNFCYIPPVNNQSIIKKLSFFDEIGKMIWPFPSGFYCYIAQKCELISPGLIQPVNPLIIKDYKSPLQPAINMSD
jgi:hypothetical protein